MTETRGRPPHPDQLTPGEWRVAEAVRHGLTNPEIAHRLGVTTDAVKFHVSNALQKLGFSSRAELRQWQGVAATSALKEGASMDTPTALSQIGQVARTVKDLASARTWYGEVLGLTELFVAGNMAFFDCAGTRLMLAEGESAGESLLYFRVPDIHAALAALTARGAEPLSAPHMIHRHEDGTEEWMAFVKDMDARPVGLMAQA